MLRTVKNNVKRKKKGFTLIELIIVMAIMAILAAIAIPGFNAIRNNARTKADTQSAETIKRAIMVSVADGTIATKSVERTITITWPSGAKTYTYSPDSGTNEFTTDEKTAITGALTELNAPQSTTRTNYVITIAPTSGDVSVN